MNDTIDDDVDHFEEIVGDVLGELPGYRAIQAIPGVGPLLAAIFVAEIGDAGRFASADKLCSWAGSPPNIASPTQRAARAHHQAPKRPVPRIAPRVVGSLVRCTTY